MSGLRAPLAALLGSALLAAALAACAPPEATAPDRAAEAPATRSPMVTETEGDRVAHVHVGPVQPAVPAAGRVRALLFFVRFADDTFDDGCARGYREWPPNADLPAMAPHVLSSSPDPPFADSSLTAFFYDQSRGALTLYGDAYGYRAGPSTDYASPRGALDRDRLTGEVLEHFAPRIPLAEYSTSGDGTLDFVFVVLRSRMGLSIAAGVGNADGIAHLGGAGRYPSGGAEVAVRASGAGTYQWYQVIRPLHDTVVLLAHEFGHPLWNGHGLFGSHLEPIVGNAVPYHPPVEAEPDDRARADRTAGYGLMTVGQGPNATGMTQLSAFERDLIGLAVERPEDRWIECRPPTPGPNTLRDVYRTGDCLRIALDTIPARHTPANVDRAEIAALYLSHITRSSPFTARATAHTTISGECPGCNFVDRSFPATGMLAEVTRRRAARPHLARRDVIPPGNRLSRHPPCQLTPGRGADLGTLHANDLWAPRHRQLSPWTRPNVYGYTYARDVPAGHFAHGWHVVDDLREGAGGVVTFDYHPDPFALPTFHVRADSWMGPETSGRAFAGALRVTDGATLTVEAGVALAITGGVVVERGGTLAVGEGAVLTLPPGAPFRIEGTLTAGGRTYRGTLPPASWPGLRRQR